MTDPPKAIGSLAKRQTELTRQGTQKLKFVPTLPARRKKEEIKAEPLSSSPSKADGGRGRGDGIGKGREHGVPRKSTEMTASGPFSMGPALSSNPPRKSAVHASLAAPTMPSTAAKAVCIPDVTPLSKNAESRPQSQYPDSDEEPEPFSEPEEGVEMIDLHAVRKLDWMAPDSLRRGRKAEKYPEIGQGIGNKNPAGEGSQLGAIIENYVKAFQNANSQEQLLFSFQFPAPFPVFSPTSDHVSPSLASSKCNISSTKTAFSLAKPEPTTNCSTVVTEQSHGEGSTCDGVIGKLEVYRSGTVRFRLGNGILLDVKSATQPTFPQQAVVLDHEDHKMVALGEIERKYLVSPDVEALLVAVDSALKAPARGYEGEDELIAMG